MNGRTLTSMVGWLIISGCISTYSGQSNAADQPAKQGGPSAASPLRETAQQRDARMKWWREARFGMFVHWGLYSGLAGTWDGKPVGTRGGMEWIQQRVKADTDTYASAAIPLFKPNRRFRPRVGQARQRGRLPVRRVHHQAPRRLRAARLEGQRLRRRLGAAAATWSRKSSMRAAPKVCESASTIR